jgi:hypothetical protein
MFSLLTNKFFFILLLLLVVIARRIERWIPADPTRFRRPDW